MNSWPPSAPAFTNALDEIVFVSRLIGSDPRLVLAGGGNTSIKATVSDALGADVDVLHIKGSGWDLATIEPSGFATLRRQRLREILTVSSLSDSAMMNELRQSTVHPPTPRWSRSCTPCCRAGSCCTPTPTR
jgi:rhamnose utilization protein RhaD (predicted bifunctional aldolase and dehydrogenase)